jgi:hypothetical protein
MVLVSSNENCETCAAETGRKSTYQALKLPAAVDDVTGPFHSPGILFRNSYPKTFTGVSLSIGGSVLQLIIKRDATTITISMQGLTGFFFFIGLCFYVITGLFDAVAPVAQKLFLFIVTKVKKSSCILCYRLEKKMKPSKSPDII